MNNGGSKAVSNGNPRSEPIKDNGSEHAYEQICLEEEPEQSTSPKYSSLKKITDNASDAR